MGLQGEKGADDSTWGEIRWAQDYDNSEHRGNLLIYPKDADEHPYVLFDGYAPYYRAIGWIWGREAKQFGKLHEDGYYIVKRERLHPMIEFPPRR